MEFNKGSARARLMATTLLAGLAAVAAPLAVTVVATAIPTLASAQDYTSGTLGGTVLNGSGQPIAGASVTVKSNAQGFTRELTTDSNGQFRVPLIPQGSYSVSISKEGYRPTSDGALAVRAGGESNYSFNLTGAEETVSEVVITATANPQLDFSQTTKGTVVDLEDAVKKMPLARSITAVTLLAPSVITGSSSGDSGFAGQPSIGGSSIAENAFYINGLNITNFDTYVGAATVPFDFYKTVEVKTGGYPAEFGRATGGVVNAVTKSGTNEFKFGVHGNFELNSLSDQSPDTFQTANRKRYSQDNSVSIEAGGPIIKDHLFFYGLAQLRDVESRTAGITSSTYSVNKSKHPFFGGKLDAFITDRQHLELTWFDTTRSTKTDQYSFTNSTGEIGTNKVGYVTTPLGGENYVAKYTGNFTDWFTLSAAYGRSSDRYGTLPADTSAPRVVDARSGTSLIISQQRTNGFEQGSTDREFYRVDGDFYFSLLGDHHVRAGFDNEKTTLFHISTLNGGGRSYTYRTGTTNAAAGAGASCSNAANSATNTRGDTRGVCGPQQYLQISYQTLGGAEVSGENQSFYIQDAWDITKQLTLQIGVRNDKFTLDNLSGQRVLNLKNNWGPRVGLTWDPTGEGKDKVYASFGRYFIPPASNLSFRGRDYGFTEYYLPAGNALTFAGQIDPVTGLPTGLGSQITTSLNIPGRVSGSTFDARSTVAVCSAPPAGLTPPRTVGTEGCVYTLGKGTQEPPNSKTSEGLKATNEDEFVIGYQRQFDSLWKAGVSLTYRKLNNVSEDVAVDVYVNEYCASKGLACDEPYAGNPDGFYGDAQYVVMNPGYDVCFLTKFPLPGETAQRNLCFSADEIRQPKAKREYVGLEVSFERAFDGKWGLQGSYVASQSKGNYEGTVLSDVGQDDAGSTQLYDHTGLADLQYGLLPNHRGHQFKLFGSYAITDNLMLGANGSVISPKHFGCLGVHPTDPDAAGYGASSRYCQEKPTPRGSQFKTDWVKRLDLSLRYTVPSSIVPLGGDLALRADVFNVFNSKAVTDSWEFGDTSTGAVDVNYKSPVAYQTPRYVRIGFDLTF